MKWTEHFSYFILAFRAAKIKRNSRLDDAILQFQLLQKEAKTMVLQAQVLPEL